MDTPGGDQIGLEPDSVETDAGIERGSDPGPAGRRGVDRDQPLGDRDCRFLAQDTVAQLALPVRIAIGIEVFHDEEAGVSILEYLDPDRYPNWKSQLRDGIEVFHDEEAGVSILGHEARSRA